MPVPALGRLYEQGIDGVPYFRETLHILPYLATIYVLRKFFNGTQNANERIMHSRVAIITGGTSGIGAAVAEELALRGCQLILLVRDTTSIFTVDYINDLRERTGNQLIYAEQCDLSDLHSVRLFATKFIDNSPPRRVDMVICCAGIMNPPGVKPVMSADGVEEQWAVNYLGHVQLLNILTPLLRVQPPDRDVRVLLATCPGYLVGQLDTDDLIWTKRSYPKWSPWKLYGATKAALMAYGVEQQRQHAAYKRPDGAPNNVRVYNIDPGFTRTLMMKRWLSLGSILGLLVYLVTWPIWWLCLKSPKSGAQTFLTAAMSPECAQGEGGRLLKECKNHEYRKPEYLEPEFTRRLTKTTNALIDKLEKASAKRRAAEEKAAKKSGGKKESKSEAGARRQKENEELIERAIKAKEAEERKKLLDKLVKAELEKGDVPSLAKPEDILRVEKEFEKKGMINKKGKEEEEEEGEVGLTADGPARNTRSRSRTPGPQVVEGSGAATGTAPGTAKRRTRKA